MTKPHIIIVVPSEVQDLKDLFICLFKEHQLMHYKISCSMSEAINYKPDVGLENAIELFKNLYNLQICKLHYNELKPKEMPRIKLTQIELENIWLYLSPVVSYNISKYTKLITFFDQINKCSNWKVYKELCQQKTNLLLNVHKTYLLAEKNDS